ncbi:MAG: hypothetical protein K6253_02845, partial [Candidatus Liberibacter asiaticus]|nr:hypothetical protein [Candidatus Liberibacter asiaticus]
MHFFALLLLLLLLLFYLFIYLFIISFFCSFPAFIRCFGDREVFAQKREESCEKCVDATFQIRY